MGCCDNPVQPRLWIDFRKLRRGPPRHVAILLEYLNGSWNKFPNRNAVAVIMVSFGGRVMDFDARGCENGAMSPQQQQDIPRVMEIGKKLVLEFPPPPGA